MVDDGRASPFLAAMGEPCGEGRLHPRTAGDESHEARRDVGGGGGGGGGSGSVEYDVNAPVSLR